MARSRPSVPFNTVRAISHAEEEEEVKKKKTENSKGDRRVARVPSRAAAKPGLMRPRGDSYGGLQCGGHIVARAARQNAEQAGHTPPSAAASR